MDYFTLFELPICYLIKDSLLTSRYQQLQLKFHPDKYIDQTECERIQTVKYAATINKAYQTLKYPLKRAEYILFLHGLDLENRKNIIYDKAFLMEQLVLREELDVIMHMINSQELLNNFATRITQIIKKHSTQMLVNLEQHKWEEAADILCKLFFLDKLQLQIEQIEEKLLVL
ncbi:co-chaperone HscB [Candidatus Profftia sp. (ex Adelges kitamiensis)]|uniref:co-chaperone HscB n=1 Tax=Candidatus Profftia sp. (ex Adelges kitamiensis) TaxID=2864218 RepID=UPI001CE25FD2|nr:co-chaperone HscB [Candidatus Profftia sp. (ex Adelges kitamiensis)]